MHKQENKKKVVILGIDGMDPKVTEQLMQDGKLPNFSYLKNNGSYSRLTTIIPSETAVVWSSFSTGLNPGSHGIFDFVMRDPQNYGLYLSLNEISNRRDRVEIQIRKKGENFWGILSRNKIPSFIYFCPNTFPPEAIFGKMVSGMGVPDISGTMGRFSFYTTKTLSKEDQESRGRVIGVQPNKNIILTNIYGPKLLHGVSENKSSVPLRITLKPEEESVYIELQGNKFILKERVWSDWKRVSFELGAFKTAYGIARFYLDNIEPDFKLYVTPINFDPQRPLFPITYPHDYSRKLSKKIGLYYTQGMPHDTWALAENRLDEKAFLEQTDEILNKNEEILKYGLKDFKGGLFFYYFETLDMVQHMFWRYIDQKHPLYENNPLFQGTIFKYYEKIDRIVGDVLKDIDEDTVLIVLSDHGFNSFRRAVHLNRWLLENGYLFLKGGVNEGREFLEDIDWSRTKAYALGFGGIYINRIGREYYGIVSESEAQGLKQTIAMGLRQFEDPQTKEHVMKNVYLQEEIFKGPYVKDSPDLFVGFNAGYRASWQTALGGAPNLLIEDNRKKWSGDHLIDPDLIPGVIFANKKIDVERPLIIDIAPTVLSLFGISKPKDMKGEIILNNIRN